MKIFTSFFFISNFFIVLYSADKTTHGFGKASLPVSVDLATCGDGVPVHKSEEYDPQETAAGNSDQHGRFSHTRKFDKKDTSN